MGCDRQGQSGQAYVVGQAPPKQSQGAGEVRRQPRGGGEGEERYAAMVQPKCVQSSDREARVVWTQGNVDLDLPVPVVASCPGVRPPASLTPRQQGRASTPCLPRSEAVMLVVQTTSLCSQRLRKCMEDVSNDLKQLSKSKLRGFAKWSCECISDSDFS